MGFLFEVENLMWVWEGEMKEYWSFYNCKADWLLGQIFIFKFGLFEITSILNLHLQLEQLINWM